MLKIKNNSNSDLYTIVIPLAIVITSCSLLILANFFTIKIQYASRAYVNGESHYSKAQKDGTRHLTTYLFTKDTKDWLAYNSEISVPLGDRAARIALLNNHSVVEVKKGFIAGRNDKKDLDAMIWLFKNFKTVPFFKKAIGIWGESDNTIEELVLLGTQIHQKIIKNEIDLTEKQILLAQINSIATKISITQSEFSNTLGNGTRAIKNYLLITNVLLTLVIVSSVGIYYNVLITKLKRSTAETDKKNTKLIIANKELDKFVYSASHDLRAPISSLQGLIAVMKLEEDTEQFALYLDMMNDSLSKQDQYIRDIIDYSRNKKKHSALTTISLASLIQQSIDQNQFLKQASKIKITTDLKVDIVHNDELRLKIIINNLVSNAVKYADTTKNNQSLHIVSYRENNCFKIEFIDNGIGIDAVNHNKIFDMFFVTNASESGSGLGLYIVKEAVENINGSITVSSEVAIGTTFIVTIPDNHDTTI